MFDTAPSNHSGTCTQSTNARSTNAHRYKYKHICIYLYTYMYTYISICISIQMFIYGCIYKCILIYIYIYMFVYICVCVYICVYMYTYVYMYIYIYMNIWRIYLRIRMSVYIYTVHMHANFIRYLLKISFKMQYIHKYQRVFVHTHMYVYINTGVCIINVCIRMFVFECLCLHTKIPSNILYTYLYGVATNSRLLKNIRLFCRI